jgi:hypothetical protein
MPDSDCDTLGLATLRTAVSVGHGHSFMLADRRQAASTRAGADRDVRACVEPASRYSSVVSGELPVEVVVRDEVAVMFKRVADEQAANTLGWAEFEQAVGSLRGRTFYGAADEGAFQGCGDGEYRICVQLRQEDDPVGLGFEVGVLPGGRYARVRLVGDPPAVYGLIAPTFERLSERPDRDRSRPGIEFYRRRDVIDLLQPVT